ncbi:hypothetical protein CK203_017616 [Vitis vinifera]|uniref:Uncharacterized protein n=1 Tax=Vitis vinifera TaxID=29760 RepID=A0A438JHA1_VITVI|nr:hypothetical protein CK203_017616 [Vitis vinifera]
MAATLHTHLLKLAQSAESMAALELLLLHCSSQRLGVTSPPISMATRRIAADSKAPLRWLTPCRITKPSRTNDTDVTAAVQDRFYPWLRQPEQARASARGRRTLKEDDEMWGSDEDGDEADGELKDTEDFDGDARRRLERWAVREFGVLGFAFNLGLSWSPIQACDGVSVWGLSKMMVMGLDSPFGHFISK